MTDSNRVKTQMDVRRKNVATRSRPGQPRDDNAEMAQERRKPGPPKTKGKDPMRAFRVSDAQWEAWRNAAEAAGISLAAWIKGACDQAVHRSGTKKRPKKRQTTPKQ
jgi:predicted HicB family RNase H-like nuclease